MSRTFTNSDRAHDTREEDAPSTSGNRGGGRGRGGRGGRGRSNFRPQPSYQQQQQTAPEENKVSKPPPPKPKALSKESSEFKDDPLYLSALKPEDRGFVQDGGVQRFTISFEGLLPLIQTVYDTLATVENSFGKGVSLSMFNYYCTVLTWTRIAKIRLARGLADDDERKLIERFGSEFPLPEPIAQYLAGIGEVKDQSGTEYRIDFPHMPRPGNHGGVQGWFGKVTADTHFMYENCLSPGLSAFRIMSDLAYESGAGEQLWNIPATLRPNQLPAVQADPGANIEARAAVVPLPTVNMLGWTYAVKPTKEQIRNLTQVGIIANDFSHDGSRFVVNVQLMDLVRRRLKSVMKFKLTDDVPGDRKGSIIQVVKISSLTSGFGRSEPYADGMVRAHTNQDLCATFADVARVFKYRVQKEDDNAHLSVWSCYDFVDYTEVPENWRVSRNTVFQYGNVAIWNATDKSTSDTDASRIRIRLVETSKVLK